MNMDLFRKFLAMYGLYNDMFIVSLSVSPCLAFASKLFKPKSDYIVEMLVDHVFVLI